MADSTATVTSKTGPAVTVTAAVITPVRRFDMHLAGKSMLFIEDDRKTHQFDISATTTCTITIASGVATITVSQ